jgi:phosphohistidine phosphatase
MLTLLLMRHAKSSWEDPNASDFERPLTKRGTKAAPEIAHALAKKQLVPDAVLCSAAVRTRATLALMLAEWDGPPPRITYDDELYLAECDELLEHIRATPADTKRLMLVGHNPGLQVLALELVGSGDRGGIAGLATKFPTAGLAVLTFDLQTWADVKLASGRLEAFLTPRTLD